MARALDSTEVTWRGSRKGGGCLSCPSGYVGSLRERERHLRGTRAGRVSLRGHTPLAGGPPRPRRGRGCGLRAAGGAGGLPAAGGRFPPGPCPAGPLSRGAGTRTRCVRPSGPGAGRPSTSAGGGALGPPCADTRGRGARVGPLKGRRLHALQQ